MCEACAATQPLAATAIAATDSQDAIPAGAPDEPVTIEAYFPRIAVSDPELPADFFDPRALKWHLRFLEMARLIAGWSKDGSTWRGASRTRPRW
jgi:hypothetical protein